MIAFWLLPAGDDAEFFTRLIGELGARLDAPLFAPHVTLFAGEVESARALECLRNIRRAAPLTLRVESIRFSDAFTKTVFVQFEASAAGSALSSQITDCLGADYELNPHLSLIYKIMPTAQKEEIARGITLPFALVRFDRVRVITGAAHTSTADDVRAWRTLGDEPLGG